MLVRVVDGRAIMATTSPHAGVVEFCEACDEDVPHSVQIELRFENDASENAAYSREPYRVTECLDCGSVNAVRMNDA